MEEREGESDAILLQLKTFLKGLNCFLIKKKGFNRTELSGTELNLTNQTEI